MLEILSAGLGEAVVYSHVPHEVDPSKDADDYAGWEAAQEQDWKVNIAEVFHEEKMALEEVGHLGPGLASEATVGFHVGLEPKYLQWKGRVVWDL